MEFLSGKFVLYIISLAVLSGLGLLVYDILGLGKYHHTDVKIFCDESVENVGVKNVRSIELLKSYTHNKSKFENLAPYKIENFFNDTIHVDNCTEGKLFSKRFTGARSVKYMQDGEEQIVTVLTENITFLEE